MQNESPIELIAAPFTPFDQQGEIQYDRIPAQARFLESQGISGVFVCGTTGEGISLTLEERKNVVLAWKAAVGPLRWFVHVGHGSLKDAQELARHAEEAGAPAIASLGPIFFPAGDAQVLTDYCRAIAEAAPRTPFYYYHMPSMARVEACAYPAMRLMIEQIPTFAGVKFTHEDVDDYRRCLELGGTRHPVFFGRDEMLLEGIRAGAQTAVGSTYNFAASLYLEIARASADGAKDRAERLQRLCAEAICHAVAEGGLSAIKVIHGLAGFDCGPVRSPLRNLQPEAKARLNAALHEIGYFGEIEACRAR